MITQIIINNNKRDNLYTIEAKKMKVIGNYVLSKDSLGKG